MFSSKLPLHNLVILCRVLRHNLSAGLSLLDVFRQQAEKGLPATRPVAARIHESLKGGANFAEALERERRSFPPMFLAMGLMGEQTGHMAELFAEMERYFSLQHRLKRQFISQSFLPAVQFVFAILIIAGLIWVLGMIAGGRNMKPPSIFGLSGTQGALIFLAVVFGGLAALGLTGVAIRRAFQYQAGTDALLLRVPALGPCMEAIAVGRMALAMKLTLDSGLPIMQAMKLSLAASGNAAYQRDLPKLLADLKKGRLLSEALPRIRLLPAEFLNMVSIAEEGGRIPEMMGHQAEYYQEETSRRMTALTRAASGMLWLVYAGFMIYTIFSIAQIYLSGLGV